MHQRGLTLVELLITLTIVGVLMAVAIPGFTTFLAKRSMSAALSDLASDFRFARAEALRRGRPVSICRTENGTSCGAQGSWSSGWIIFTDANPTVPPVVDGGDEVIRVQGAPSGIASIAASVASSTRVGVSFRANGLAIAGNESFIFTPSVSGSGVTTRLFCVNVRGRPSVRPEGQTSCL